MKISRLIIKNYRNLKDIDICLGETVVLVGENNSGKSNLLLQYPRDYRCINGDVETVRSYDNYFRLCEYIRKFYDYFVYPHFCRDNKNITSFYDYTKYIRNINHYDIRDKEKFVYSLMKQEFDNACVRDINEDLFINNTEYHEDMSHESWRPLSDLL